MHKIHVSRALFAASLLLPRFLQMLRAKVDGIRPIGLTDFEQRFSVGGNKSKIQSQSI